MAYVANKAVNADAFFVRFAHYKCAGYGRRYALHLGRIVSTTLVVLFSVFTSSTVAAPPDSVVQRVMAEPATMFDLGLYRLENHLEEEWEGRLGIYASNVDSTNQYELPGSIIINLYFDVWFFTDARERCEEIIEQFRIEEYVSATGDYSSDIGGYFFHNQFNRRGYDMDSQGRRDVEFIKSFLSQFTLNVSQAGRKTSCHGAWLGDAITFD